MSTRLARSSVGLLVAVIGGCSPEPKHLQLSETSALIVPDSVGIAGVALGPDGELLLWTPNQGRVVWIRGAARHDLIDAMLVRPIGAAVLDRSIATTAAAGTVETLDAANGALVRFNPKGRFAGLRKIPSWAGADHAQRTRTGWFVLLPDSSRGRGYSVEFLADTAVLPKRVFVIHGNGTAKAKSVRLSAWGDSLIVSDVRNPYASIVIASNGSGTRTLIGPSTIPELRQTRYTWLAMPLIPVRPGFVQVFADAGSDRRLFVTYGRDRNPVRTSLLDAPVGIIGARRDPDYLLGMRRVGRTEVVRYRWEWTK